MPTTTPVDWFQTWFDTPYYHLLHNDQASMEAATFSEELVKYLQLKAGASVLEVGCGKGALSKYLSEKGFDVTGIDLSPFAIEQAKPFESDHLHFYRHDLRQPSWINYFDAAFNLYSSYGYFKTARENEAAIRGIANALNQKGKLVIDYLNTHYHEDHFVHATDKEKEGYNFHITCGMDEEFFYKKIEVEHDSFTEPHVYHEKMTKYSLGDFTDMLAYQGMQVEDVFGDYNLSSYHVRKTPRMIMVARKIGWKG